MTTHADIIAQFNKAANLYNKARENSQPENVIRIYARKYAILVERYGFDPFS